MLQKINTKKEMTDFIYLFRYYINIPVNSKKSIKDVKELEKEIENIFYIAIKKACKLKLVITVYGDAKTNCEILKSRFYSKIIDLEDMEIELEQNENILRVIICEEEAIDNVREIEVEQEDGLILKYSKKVKVFL